MPNGTFSATEVGTDSGAEAIQAAMDNGTGWYVVTSISGHTDTDSVLTIESPDDTVLWEAKIDVSVEGFNFNYDNLCIVCPAGGVAHGAIASSTTDCQVTISGEVYG